MALWHRREFVNFVQNKIYLNQVDSLVVVFFLYNILIKNNYGNYNCARFQMTMVQKKNKTFYRLRRHDENIVVYYENIS